MRKILYIMLLIIMFSFKKLCEFTIIVKGDFSGDGLVRLYDAFKIITNATSAGLNFSKMDIYIMDYNNDGNIKIYDAFRYLQIAILN